MGLHLLRHLDRENRRHLAVLDDALLQQPRLHARHLERVGIVVADAAGKVARRQHLARARDDLQHVEAKRAHLPLRVVGQRALLVVVERPLAQLDQHAADHRIVDAGDAARGVGHVLGQAAIFARHLRLGVVERAAKLPAILVLDEKARHRAQHRQRQQHQREAQRQLTLKPHGS